MSHARAYAAAVRYARVPAGEVHSDLLHRQPDPRRIREVIDDYLGESPAAAELRLLVPDGRGYDRLPLPDHAVRPLREAADRLGVRPLRTLLRPRPNRLGTLLQTLAFGSAGKDATLAALASAVLRDPHEGTHAAALSDYLHETDHPAAGAVDWQNLSRGLRLEDLTRRVMHDRLEYYGDIARHGSPRLIDMVRRDAAYQGSPDLSDATDAEVRDAAVRLHAADHENARVPARWHLHPGLDSSAGAARRRTDARFGDPDWPRAVADAHRYRGPSRE